MEEKYIVKNRERFILISSPIDCKLGRWYKAATNIHDIYLHVIKLKLAKKTQVG